MLARNLVLRIASATHVNHLALPSQASDATGGRIIIVAMHETLGEHAEQFRRQLGWVAEHFKVIDPETFARAIETKVRPWTGSRPAVLFTFDDGRESNYLVAAPILESLGARGIFFVVPRFIGLTAKESRDFYYSRIDVRNMPRDGQAEEEVWKPMTPDQLADLTRRGHWIGNHTLSHVRLTGLSEKELALEIEQSSRQITDWTGQPVDAFAWTYAWDAIDRKSSDLIKKNHRFCFAPCPGTVDIVNDSPFLLWRKEIESYYAPSEYEFMYGMLVDLFWQGKRNKLRKLLI